MPQHHTCSGTRVASMNMGGNHIQGLPQTASVTIGDQSAGYLGLLKNLEWNCYRVFKNRCLIALWSNVPCQANLPVEALMQWRSRDWQACRNRFREIWNPDRRSDSRHHARHVWNPCKTCICTVTACQTYWIWWRLHTIQAKYAHAIHRTSMTASLPRAKGTAASSCKCVHTDIRSHRRTRTFGGTDGRADRRAKGITSGSKDSCAYSHSTSYGALAAPALDRGLCGTHRALQMYWGACAWGRFGVYNMREHTLE